MAQGRDSSAAVGVALLCLLVSHCKIVESATFTVGGGGGGWGFNVVNWPKGKTFKAGDVLAFNYNPQLHNVVVVNAAGYNSCRAASGSRVFSSGNDRITLKKGKNFFICSIPGHCNRGMKISIRAA